ncbi:hypothetical protein N177_3031 [Lutibaculum baratangense AMV1]|uniref:Uncharacterized protein n=1 Tax=Lutibaculum baratangense AMV1 TaxID=631454 RepID=V4RCA6_9HYPH|nr:hypothetical protein N177_3031 [Lutibaculum baratangense AMV1]
MRLCRRGGHVVRTGCCRHGHEAPVPRRCAGAPRLARVLRPPMQSCHGRNVRLGWIQDT